MHLYNRNKTAFAETNSVFIFVNDQNCNYETTYILLRGFLCACGDIVQYRSTVILSLLVIGNLFF